MPKTKPGRETKKAKQPAKSKPPHQTSQTDPRFYQVRNALADGDFSTALKLRNEEPGVVHFQNGLGETVLHFLAVENHQESVAWLLEQGADINTRNDFGDTPLMDAVLLGYFDLCRFLLDKGTGLQYANHTGKTALTIAATKACKTGDTVILSLLLQRTTQGRIESARRRFASQERLWRKLPSASASPEVVTLLRQHGFMPADTTPVS